MVFLQPEIQREQYSNLSFAIYLLQPASTSVQRQTDRPLHLTKDQTHPISQQRSEQLPLQSAVEPPATPKRRPAARSLDSGLLRFYFRALDADICWQATSQKDLASPTKRARLSPRERQKKRSDDMVKFGVKARQPCPQRARPLQPHTTPPKSSSGSLDHLGPSERQETNPAYSLGIVMSSFTPGSSAAQTATNTPTHNEPNHLQQIYSPAILSSPLTSLASSPVLPKESELATVPTALDIDYGQSPPMTQRRSRALRTIESSPESSVCNSPTLITPPQASSRKLCQVPQYVSETPGEEPIPHSGTPIRIQDSHDAVMDNPPSDQGQFITSPRLNSLLSELDEPFDITVCKERDGIETLQERISSYVAETDRYSMDFGFDGEADDDALSYLSSPRSSRPLTTPTSTPPHTPRSGIPVWYDVMCSPRHRFDGVSPKRAAHEEWHLGRKLNAFEDEEMEMNRTPCFEDIGKDSSGDEDMEQVEDLKDNSDDDSEDEEMSDNAGEQTFTGSNPGLEGNKVVRSK